MAPTDDDAAGDPRRLRVLARGVYQAQRRSLLTLTAWTAVLYLVPLAALHAHASMAVWRLAALGALLLLSLALVAQRLLRNARTVHSLVTTMAELAVETRDEGGDGAAERAPGDDAYQGE